MQSRNAACTVVAFAFMAAAGPLSAEPKTAHSVEILASSAASNGPATNAVDGVVSDSSRWLSQPSDREPWLEVRFGSEVELAGVHLYSGFGGKSPVQDFDIQWKAQDGAWRDVPSAKVRNNTATALRLPFDDTQEIRTPALRLRVLKTPGGIARVGELRIWLAGSGTIPQLEAGNGATDVNLTIAPLYLNQSGFNSGKPKRFTAPTLADGTTFIVREKSGIAALFKGVISGQMGDFSAFNPEGEAEYVVEAGGLVSVPFRIGQWWLERVTYQKAMDFMIDSRHYVGNYRKACVGSFAWRDDHHFAWALNTLVPQYLSNPSAYERMPRRIRYEEPAAGSNLWGALKPYDESAPDIVKLIHWGADVSITQNTDHELLKGGLAYFLYAWPWLQRWLPQQNYRAVLDYTLAHWTDETLPSGRKYRYDLTSGHNLLALKTTIGTTKGENPPGHSVMPNLLLYETAKREKLADAEKYFQAAFRQVEWMIANLDWNNPLTTKGQRQAEHVTMTGLAFMAAGYPDRAPAGLREKIKAWAQVMISRSANMWDFRRLSADQWTPTGEKRTMWNEPGNVVGFPASLLAAMSVITDAEINRRLEQLVYSHLDNAFGRNPTGRHFSHDAPLHIEGVEYGWYSEHQGGIGMLGDVTFVLDGAPKNEHYPYHPEAGNVGWTEGWVNFNTAYNLSLAWLAKAGTRLECDWQGGKLQIRLCAPLNFDYAVKETARVNLLLHDGVQREAEVAEESTNSPWFSTVIELDRAPASVSYGYGYMQTEWKPGNR